MKGAPANPISGVAPSSATARPTPRVIGSRASAVSSGRAVHVGVRADGGLHHRAHAGDDVDPDPGQLERNHDVGEVDARIDAVAPDRLAGDLGGQARVEAGLQHARRGPQRPVLGQGTAGLAHHPDRTVSGPLAPVGTDQR